MATQLSLPAFRLALPDGWVEQTIYMFVGPADGGHQHHLSLQVDADPSSTDLGEYAEARLQAQIENLPGAETEKYAPLELPGGMEAHVTTVKWRPGKDEVLFFRQVFVERSGTIFALAGNFTKKSLPTLGGQMDMMAATINLPGNG